MVMKICNDRICEYDRGTAGARGGASCMALLVRIHNSGSLAPRCAADGAMLPRAFSGRCDYLRVCTCTSVTDFSIFSVVRGTSPTLLIFSENPLISAVLYV
jgi:hypothetical protein